MQSIFFSPVSLCHVQTISSTKHVSNERFRLKQIIHSILRYVLVLFQGFRGKESPVNHVSTTKGAHFCFIKKLKECL